MRREEGNSRKCSQAKGESGEKEGREGGGGNGQKKKKRAEGETDMNGGVRNEESGNSVGKT